MNRDYKGQVATEFFAYAGVFLLVVVITAASIYFVQDTEYAYYENRYMIEIGHKFSSAYNLAVSAGTGFTYEMEFPKTIKGYAYNITFIENTSILIEYSGIHGDMIYPYPMSPFSLEFEGCIITLPTADNRGVLLSDIGENEVVFYNDGSVITIRQEGCP